MDVDEIAIKLGVKTGDFKAALADANAKVVEFKKAGQSGPDEGLAGTLKATKREMREFKELLVGGGMIEAVKAFFEFAIARAEELKYSTNKNVIAVQEFGEALKGGKSAAGDAAVFVVGGLNRIGAAIGENIKEQAAYITGGNKKLDVVREQAEAEEKSSNDARAREKILADERKRFGAELVATNKQINDLLESRALDETKGTDAYKTQANVAEHLADLLQKQDLNEGTILDKRKLQLEILKTQKALEEATLEVNKKQIEADEEWRQMELAAYDEQKKALADRIKRTEEAIDLAREDMTLSDRKKSIVREIAQIEEELYFTDRSSASGRAAALDGENRLQRLNVDLRKEGVDQGKSNVEIAQLLLKGVKNLNPVEKERLALLQGQTTEHKEQIELQQLLDKGVENLTEVERARLEVLAGQVAEVKKQAEAVVDLLDEWNNFSTTITRTGASYDQQSTAALQGLASRLQHQLTSVDEQGHEIKDADINSDYAGWLQANTIRGELSQVMQELQSRSQIQATIRSLGENAARATYGDTATDNALREMQGATQQSASSLNQINQKLGLLLGSG